MNDPQLRNQIIVQLFEGVDPSSESAKTSDKLIFFAKVTDGEIRKLFKGKKDDDDDQDDDKGKQAKQRIIVVSGNR